MIENKNEVSKDLEKALQALEQAKQRVANEKKKQNEKKRKSQNHHKYIMGGIIVKYFPNCYHYDELNRILSVVLQTRECQQMITKIKAESTATSSPHSTYPMPKIKARVIRNDKSKGTGEIPRNKGVFTEPFGAR